MAIGGFADQAVAAGGFAVEWNSLRFIMTPTEGVFANQQLRLEGVWEMSGEGFAREGVNLIFPADGTGVAKKITKGREKPSEISLGLDPLTMQNVVVPAVCPPKSAPRKFNFEVQRVDPAGVTTYSKRWTGCVVTGSDADTSADSPHKDTLKFQPTARA